MHGWVGFNIDYRLSPAATFPDHLVDVKRAIAWVREHAAEYGADPDFICLTGGSAGGHLCALAALTADDPAYQPGFEDADTSVAAAVPFYGVYDLTDSEGIYYRELLEWVLERYVLQGPLADDPELLSRRLADPPRARRARRRSASCTATATRWSRSTTRAASSRELRAVSDEPGRLRRARRGRARLRHRARACAPRGWWRRSSASWRRSGRGEPAIAQAGARARAAECDRLGSRRPTERRRPVDVSALKNTPLFADVPDEALTKVATFATLESVAEGKTIIREGGFSNDFYVIEEGTVKVEREGEHLADLGPGDVFGEQGLLEKQERSATVTATSPVRLIKIEHWELVADEAGDARGGRAAAPEGRRAHRG